MANRHERRKAMKVMRTDARLVAPDDARQFLAPGSECAWEGCKSVTSDHRKDGWSGLLLFSGKFRTNILDITPMERDCVLCPEHAAYLDEHLLKDIGGRLRNVAGNA